MNTVTYRDTSQSISVGKIFCLVRNYAAHTKEMKSDIPANPVVFLKPATAIVPPGGLIVAPAGTGELHHEVEMVALLGKGGRNVTPDHANSCIAAYGIGLDMTLRDLQSEAKGKGLPWTISKGFDGSAPVSAFTPADKVKDPYNLELILRVNGIVRQKGNTSAMLFRLDAIIGYLSRFFTLERGDLIFTGTPDGVGAVSTGDLLEAELAGVASLRAEVG